MNGSKNMKQRGVGLLELMLSLAISQSLEQTLSGSDTVNSSTDGSSGVMGCGGSSNTITAVYNN